VRDAKAGPVDATRRGVKHSCSLCQCSPGVSAPAAGARGGEWQWRVWWGCRRRVRAMHGRDNSRSEACGRWMKEGCGLPAGAMHGGSFVPHVMPRFSTAGPELQHHPQRAAPAPHPHTTMGHGGLICWTACRSRLSPAPRCTTTLSRRAS
jgi:hypothetical protein